MPTCLSFNPISNTSSIKVNFGALLRSSLSLISRGSKAILCPFSPPVYAVSGARPLSSFPLPGTGEPIRLPSSVPSAVEPDGPAPPPAPRRRVRPPVEAMLVFFGSRVWRLSGEKECLESLWPKLKATHIQQQGVAAAIGDHLGLKTRRSIRSIPIQCKLGVDA